MKLKKFDSTNAPANTSRGRLGRSAIRLHQSGVVTLSAIFVEKMGLKAADKIAISQDEEQKENWYLSKDPNGFDLRLADAANKSSALKFNCAGVCKLLWDQFKLPDDKSKTVLMLMAGTPETVERVKYWGILTPSATWSGKI